MKKKIILSTILSFGLCSILPLTNVLSPALAESTDGYVEVEKNVQIDGKFSAVTNSPWVNDTKLIFNFDSVSINKAYIVFDYDVTLSNDNPELVTRIGINDAYFQGHDGTYYHGSNYDVMKNWGDWFFLPVGRNKVYFPVTDFCSSVASMNNWGLYFDTFYEKRSGSSIDIYGLYLVDSYDDELENNIILPEDYIAEETKITKLGIDLTIFPTENADQILGAYLYGDYVNSLRMHVKNGREGGIPVSQPDDYGYLSISLNEAFDVSSDEGFAFSIFACSGYTYFRIVLEDDEGYFYMPVFNGGPKDSAGSYPMINYGTIGSILHFYGALYLDDQDFGTVYIPYKSFVGLNYMFEESQPLSPHPIQKIKTIHVGMDMNYGLGRNLVINEFATCDVETESITSMLQMSKMSETEWNRNKVLLSTNITIHGLDAYANNYVVSVVDKYHVPGAKEEVDISELQHAVNLAKTFEKEDYTEQSWSNLMTKLENAENLLQYSSLYEQSDIENATSELLVAIRQLKPIAEVEANNDVNPLIIIIISISSVILLSGAVIGIVFVIKKKRGKKYEK